MKGRKIYSATSHKKKRNQRKRSSILFWRGEKKKGKGTLTPLEEKGGEK